jgi:hypothetical protein
MGFKEVVLLGIDHSYVNKNIDESYRSNERGFQYTTEQNDSSHFDKDYLPTNSEFHLDLFAMEKGYAMAKKIFEQDGRKIVNASPGSHLDVYEKVLFESLFDD